MIKTQMTILGKIFMGLFFFTAGLATGYYTAKQHIENSGISIEVDKVKKNGNVIIDLNQEKNKKRNYGKGKKYK